MAFLTIDIGNTRVKLAAMESYQILSRWECPLTDLEKMLEKLICDEGHRFEKIGWISVGKEINITAWKLWEKLPMRPQLVAINHHTHWPIPHQYDTPETLGTDRIVAVIGALQMVEAQPVLVIDAGTAITYDCARADRTYLGGAIGPGMSMRFKALHEFTARLPLIKPSEDVDLIGKSTLKSIQSGVIQAMTAEISGMIEAYRAQLGTDMVVFLTGGDGPFFEKRLKNINFATSSIIHTGINHILKLSL
ncbi:MAG: type III pantothenate kinase [Bacteroidota bacterium]